MRKSAATFKCAEDHPKGISVQKPTPAKGYTETLAGNEEFNKNIQRNWQSSITAGYYPGHLAAHQEILANYLTIRLPAYLAVHLNQPTAVHIQTLIRKLAPIGKYLNSLEYANSSLLE